MHNIYRLLLLDSEHAHGLVHVADSEKYRPDL